MGLFIFCSVVNHCKIASETVHSALLSLDKSACRPDHTERRQGDLWGWYEPTVSKSTAAESERAMA